MLASAPADTPRLIVGKLNAALNSDDVHVGAGEKNPALTRSDGFCSNRDVAILRNFYSIKRDSTPS
jgi:hypothetical protein